MGTADEMLVGQTRRVVDWRNWVVEGLERCRSDFGMTLGTRVSLRNFERIRA